MLRTKNHHWNPFEEALKALESGWHLMPFDGRHQRGGQFAAINAWMNEEQVTLDVALPGVDPEQVEITTENQILKIAGKREDSPADRRWLRRERRSGEFERSVQLPFRIDPDLVSASYRHGMLRITIGRPEELKPRKIQIQSD